MRIVVISDSHGRSDLAERIVEEQPTARHIFFLGDLTADAENLMYLYPQKELHAVSGNCDIFSPYPCEAIAEVAGHRIFYAHGHTLGVKYGTERLLRAAAENECDIVLYGHTHISKTVYENGIYLVNPGSCARPREGARSYAVIDIENNGIMPFIVRLK